jgi:hypothetical protein
MGPVREPVWQIIDAQDERGEQAHDSHDVLHRAGAGAWRQDGGLLACRPSSLPPALGPANHRRCTTRVLGRL